MTESGALTYDIHVHIFGTDTARHRNYLSPKIARRLSVRLMLRQLGISTGRAADVPPDDLYREKTLAWLAASRVDRAVLLALDGSYTRDGIPDKQGTAIIVDNDYVADLCEHSEKLLFGASIHPYRRDARKELERLLKRGACLIKWLPSTQNIKLDDPLCFPFYDMLAHYKIPLLCHLGNEHALALHANALNDPRRLAPALARGVTVIGAHLGARLYLHEKTYYHHWRAMALAHENFYGDISALALPVRAGLFRELRKDARLAAKLIYGSDFPTLVMPGYFVMRLGLKQARQLSKLENPFDKSLLTYRATGLPAAVFSRAGQILRLPARVAAC